MMPTSSYIIGLSIGWLFFSLGIVTLFGRWFDEGGCPPFLLFLTWPIILPITGLVFIICKVYGIIDDFLREFILS